MIVILELKCIVAIIAIGRASTRTTIIIIVIIVFFLQDVDDHHLCKHCEKGMYTCQKHRWLRERESQNRENTLCEV